MIQYGEIFVGVSQRVAAFKHWTEYMEQYGSTYGEDDEDDYLDEVYRFLYEPASKKFIAFCAKKARIGFDKYCDNMMIDKDELIGKRKRKRCSRRTGSA